MRIVGFLPWLIEKYPKVVVGAKEDAADATEIDATAPNLNGIEFDNFYIDMEVVIQLSAESPDGDPDIDRKFHAVFCYIDQLFAIVRPRKLLFLALSGVAPKAQMIKTRADNFLSARTDEIVEGKVKELLEKYEKQGKKVRLQKKPESYLLPGTKFMFELSKALESYVKARISSNPAWRDIKVIISDANVPGIAEQKIMWFIRSQRTLPGYNPNTRHCMYSVSGANPVLLALATHEVHFSILWYGKPPPLATMSSCQQEDLDLSDESKRCLNSDNHAPVEHNHMLFHHISILREYLELELQLSNVPVGFKFDLERVVDDFIFICFFLDNKILPEMPTLKVHERGIDLLMSVYKDEFMNLGGYLVDTQLINEGDETTAYINLKRVERFILSVGSYEDQIFQKRQGIKQHTMRRILSEITDSQICNKRYGINQHTVRRMLSEIADSLDEKTKIHNYDGGEPMVSPPAVNLSTQDHDALQDTNQFLDELSRILQYRSEAFRIRSYCNHDTVNFGSFGWKERYYRDKFSAFSQQEMESTRRAVVKGYAEGLCWLLQYYFSCTVSWTWFYPYYHGPCASDFRGLSQVKVEFDMGSPLAPFDQLMATLHPMDASELPSAYSCLMTDPYSEIHHFYPKEFVVDFDAKRRESHGIAHLPFIDEKMLLVATRKAAEKIDSSEAERNNVTVNKLLLRTSSKFGHHIQSLFLHLVSSGEEASKGEMVGVRLCLDEPDAIAGFIHVPNDGLYKADEIVSCLNYEFPIHREIVNRPIAGLQFPERSVCESDIQERLLWHKDRRGRPPHVQDRSRKKLWEDIKPFKTATGSGGTKDSTASYPATSVGDSEYTSVNIRPAPQAYVPPHRRHKDAMPSSSSALPSNSTIHPHRRQKNAMPSSSPALHSAYPSNLRTGPPANQPRH